MLPGGAVVCLSLNDTLQCSFLTLSVVHYKCAILHGDCQLSGGYWIS